MKNKKQILLSLFVGIFLTTSMTALNAQYTVQGSVSLPMGFPLNGIEIYYGGVLAANTDNTGAYHFETSSDAPTVITLKYQGDGLQGINTGDIVRIENHILDRNRLSEPGKLISADVNQSGKITVADIIEIHRLILGKSDNFSVGSSFTFLPASLIPDFSNWNLLPRWITSDFSGGNTFIADFKGYKLGDVGL